MNHSYLYYCVLSNITEEVKHSSLRNGKRDDQKGHCQIDENGKGSSSLQLQQYIILQ